MKKRVLDLMIRVFDFVEEHISIFIVFPIIHAFLYGLFGPAYGNYDNDAIMKFAKALFKYPGFIMECILAVGIVVGTISSFLIDILSDECEHYFLKCMAIILILCFILVVVEHIGAVIAQNILFLFLIGIGLTVMGTASVAIVSNGLVVFEGVFMATTIFAEFAGAVFTMAAVVTALSVIADTIMSLL